LEEYLLVDQIDDRLAVCLQLGVPAQQVFHKDRLAALPAGPLLVQQVGRQPLERFPRLQAVRTGPRSRLVAITHGPPRQGPGPEFPGQRRGRVVCAPLPESRPAAGRWRPPPRPLSAVAAAAIRQVQGGGAPSPQAPPRPRASLGSSRGLPPAIAPPRPLPVG